MEAARLLQQISQAEHDDVQVAEAARILVRIKDSTDDKEEEDEDEDVDDDGIEGSTRSPSLSPGSEGQEAGTAAATTATRRINIGCFDPADPATHTAIVVCCRNGDYVTGLPYANNKRSSGPTVSMDELRRRGYRLKTKVMTWGPAYAFGAEGRETVVQVEKAAERSKAMSPDGEIKRRRKEEKGKGKRKREEGNGEGDGHTGPSGQPVQSKRKPVKVNRAPAAATAAAAGESREEQVTAVTARGRKVHMPKKFGE
ncbi:MAG: hypothetical protein Q9207_005962 [Kuettlingeria erythrocarpa]